MEAKQFWRFENSATGGSEATLYIYGDIMLYDMEWLNWPDDVVPHRFKNELTALGDVGTIHVRINSNGGSVFGAYAIMNLLKSHKAHVITYNDGIAASAATLVAMAGDKIVSSLGSVWMMHLPSTTVAGNVNELKKAIEILEVITESMADIYYSKTGIERNKILQMMKSDKWLTGKDALALGLVDEVSDYNVEAYVSEDKATAFFGDLKIDMGKIRNKESFVAMLPSKVPARESKENHPPSAQAVENKEEVKVMTNVMTLAELKAKHPEIYQAALDEGKAQAPSQEALDAARKEGAQAERERIKAIDETALPGTEDLTNKAKYETLITAEKYAMEILKAQKEKGVNYLNAAKADAAGIDDVPAAGAPFVSDEEEETALLAHLAVEAKKYE